MKTLLQEIEEASLRHPDRMAVRCGKETVTYRELRNCYEELSNLISLCVAERDEGPNHPVAIFLEPSIHQVTAILAALKSGRPYLPINPAFPTDYIQYLLSDAKPVVVITSRADVASPDIHALLSGAAGSAKIEILEIKGPDSNRSLKSRTPRPQQASSDLFAILYTSGSTGTPKGTLVPVAGIENRIQWMRRFSGIGETDVVAQKTTYCFDVSIWEFILPLTSGALLTIADPKTRHDAKRLLHFLEDQASSIVHFVPSQFSEIISAIETEPHLAACLKTIRLIVFSGEALHRPVLSRFQKLCGRSLRPDIRLANLYGPTEASVDVTCYPISFPFLDDAPGATVHDSRIPIGRAIDNVEIALVCDEGRICKTGEEGEIHISGICLAKGYLNRPELSEKSFPVISLQRHDGFQEPSKRYFRTGDLAQYDHNGHLVFIGRRDSQIKIRGFRVELDGIQKLLAAHEAVATSVVLLENNAVGYQQIIVYYISRPEGIDSAGIKAYLAKQLPSYHLPHKVIRVDKIPLNSHGKVDRGRLSGELCGDGRPESTREEGHDSRTQTLIGIWQKFLGVSPIRPEDDFFALGGDSIMAMALATECRGQGIMTISPGAILKSGTIKRLLESTRDTPSAGPVNGADGAAETSARMEMDPFQKYMVFIDRFYPENHLFTQLSCLAVEDPNDVLREDRLRRAVASLARRHSTLTCALSPDSRTLVFYPGLAGGLEEHAPLTASDFSHLNESEFQRALEQIVHLEKQVGFDLKSPPLFRFRLIAGPARKKYLLSSFHHLICDGWSQKILIADLTRFLAREQSSAPQDSTNRADGLAAFLSLRHRRLTDERRGVLRQFWEERLASPLSHASFPQDFGKESRGGLDGVNRRFLCRNHVSTLTRELTDQIVRRSCHVGVTLTSYLMGLFFILYGRMTGQTDLMLLTNIALRDFWEDPAAHTTVGCLVNQLLVRLRLDPANLKGDIVARQVHRTLLEARDHAEIPIQDLFEILRVSRGGSAGGLGEADLYRVPVNFSFHNEPSSPGGQASGLTLTPVLLPVTSPELMVGASVEDGHLIFNWSFPEDLYLPETVRSLAGQYHLIMESECLYG